MFVDDLFGDVEDSAAGFRCFVVCGADGSARSVPREALCVGSVGTHLLHAGSDEVDGDQRGVARKKKERSVDMSCRRLNLEEAEGFSMVADSVGLEVGFVEGERDEDGGCFDSAVVIFEEGVGVGGAGDSVGRFSVAVDPRCGGLQFVHDADDPGCCDELHRGHSDSKHVRVSSFAIVPPAEVVTLFSHLAATQWPLPAVGLVFHSNLFSSFFTSSTYSS